MVEEDFAKVFKNMPAKDELQWLADLFDIKNLYTEKINPIIKRGKQEFQIVKALLLQPLLLDNPLPVLM